jgi:hypothetical protein
MDLCRHCSLADWGREFLRVRKLHGRPRPRLRRQVAKASAPSPGATAKNTTEKTSIGKGATSVKASQPSSFWTEELDVRGDGTIETRSAAFGCRFDANGNAVAR